MPAIQEEWDLSSIVWISEPPFLFSNSHLSRTFLVSFYPQAFNILGHVSFIFWRRMTISHSLAFKMANCDMFLSIYLSFLHYVWLSHKKSSEIDFKFKNDLLIKKKKMSGSDELRLDMSSNCWSWLMGPYNILFLCLTFSTWTLKNYLMSI